jgi:hypothetical protein
MRAGVARIMAGWIVVAVAASAVMTCTPGAMRADATPMASCAGMHDQQHRPGVSSDAVPDCCVHHTLSLTAAKPDLQRHSLQPASPWPAWIAPVVIAPTSRSVLAAETPPGLISSLGPPTYIALSTLRV